MAHKNTGTEGHTNTGYNNHVNTGADEHVNTGYNNHNNTGYSNHANTGYTNHANYHYYNYTQSGYSRYQQYYGRHGNYNNYNCHSNYTNNAYANAYTNHANYHYYNHTNTGGFHTNTGANEHVNTGYTNHNNTGYSNHNNQGSSTHSNTGYSNHLNYTNNHAPTMGGAVSPTNPSAYYKDTVALSWNAPNDTSAEPIQEHTPSLVNGFTDYGGSHKLKVYKTKEGSVYIRGLVNVPSDGVGKTIFTLPVGWRPTEGSLIYGQRNVTAHCRVNVSVSGAVSMGATKRSPVDSWLSLSLSFNADASGWEPIPLLARYVNYSAATGGWGHARCKKTASGIVFVEGLIKRDTYSKDNTTVGILPNGMKPGLRLLGSTCAIDDICRMDYMTDGSIYIDSNPTTADGSWVSIVGSFLSTSNTDPWTTMTTSNGWVQYSTGYGGPRIKKLKSGEVFIEGLLKSGTVTDDTLMATIPTNMRMPSPYESIFPIYQSGATPTNAASVYCKHNGYISPIRANSGWTSVVSRYITGIQQQDSTFTYKLEYAHKTPLGGYGAWTQIATGISPTTYNYNLSAHASGYIKFRISASDGVETSGYVYSSELRVLKYNAPSITNSSTGGSILSTDYKTIAVELNKLAVDVGVAGDLTDTLFNSPNKITAADVGSLVDKSNEIQAAIDSTSPNVKRNVGDVIYAADVNVLKNFLKNK